MKLGGIYVDVGARTSQLKRDLKEAEGIVGKSAVLMQQEIGRISFAHLAIAATAFGVAASYGMKKAIDAASDLQEVTSKFGVVFKDQIVSAEKNANILVESYAMSTREAKQYLSSVQDLLVPMGMASKEAGVLSQEIVKLSADLGSFNNLPTERVMLDIQSALVGNFETMKKYGVVLNATVVAEKAMAMGLAKTKNEVTANIRAQAAYALMIEGSKAAIGDMARTSGDYANQTKQLKANVEDMTAAIGDRLLPIVTEWIVEANKWFKSNDRIIDQLGTFAETILNLTTTLMKATGFLIEYFNVWVNTVQALGLASSGQITLNEAITNGAEALERFNMGLSERAKIFSIGPQTKGWDIYSPPTPEETDIVSGLPAMGGDITDADAKRQEELEKLIVQEEEKYRIATEGWTALDEALINRYGYLEQMDSEHKSRLLSAEEKYQKDKLKWTKDSYKQTLDTTQYTFNTLMNLTQGHSKAIFEVMKAASIANAIVSTYTGAANAMATVPYPYNFAAAASVIAYGLAQVQQIRAQSFSGGGGGGGGGGGAVSYENTPTYNPPPYEEEEKKGSLTINIHGDFIGDESYIELLAEKISEAVEDRDVTLIASSSKYADLVA